MPELLTNAPFLDELLSRFAHVVVDRDALVGVSQDSADLFDRPPSVALAAAYPTTTGEVVELVKLAASHRVPVVAQGSRTGLAGGANAMEGALLICLERMNRIVDIDVDNRIAVVQPGVINASLRRAVAERGLFYPPDPSSWEMSSIGGNVSTNAGGMCCIKYGVTSAYVLGLEVVLANSDVLRCGRKTVKGVAGYDLTQLFVGSEGTLGVITEITLALRPAPKPALTLVAIFESKRAAGAAVIAISTSGVGPSMLEMLDRVHLRAIESFRRMDLNVDAEAMLIVGSDSGAEAASDLARVAELCKAAGAVEVEVATDLAEAEALVTARRLAQPAMKFLAETTFGADRGDAVVEDVSVPRSRLVDLLEAVDAVASAQGVIIGFHGHAGDGNLHPTILMDRQDPASLAAARKAFDEVMRITLELGGTCTGEHGVGLLKRDWLAREVGPVGIRVHQAIKAALDPENLFNPGKVFEAASTATTQTAV